MFWHQKITVSNIETILERQCVELEELLNEEDILQECKIQNRKLIEFLSQPSSMDKMVNFITQDPDELTMLKMRYKYANLACELLTFEIEEITEALITQEPLLNKLYNFIDTEKPLNPLLASFFSKTVGLLLTKKSENLITFLKSKGNFIELMLRHIETSAIMNLLLKFLIFTPNNEDTRTNVIKWLDEENVIKRLVALIDSSASREANDNAAQVLCDTIKATREQMSLLQENAEPHPLLIAAESVETISDLLNRAFGGEKKESVIVNCISVILTILEFKKYGSNNNQQLFAALQIHNHSLQANNELRTLMSFSPYDDGPEQMTSLDMDRLFASIGNALKAIVPYLPNIHETLINPPFKSAITLTTGSLDPPLGFTRLEIARLVVALLFVNARVVNLQFAELGTILVLLDLFFKYKWNNFLHTQVEVIIKKILMDPPSVDEDGNKFSPLLEQILTEYKITERILENFEKSEEVNSKKNGYMGHLTKIANHIAQAIDSGDKSMYIKEKINSISEEHFEKWEKFVNTTLTELNTQNTTPLVIDVPSNSPDPFAFNDKFIEADEALTNHIGLSAQLVFTNEISRSGADLFEQVCRDKNQALSPTDDIDIDEDDVWDERDGVCDEREDKEILFMGKHHSNDNDDDSSDSDDENNVSSTIFEYGSVSENKRSLRMDIDIRDNWSVNLDNVPMDVIPVSSSNPWEAAEPPSSTSGEQELWADFSNFSTAPVEENKVSSSTTVNAMDISEEPLPSSTDVGEISTTCEISYADVASGDVVLPVKKEENNGESLILHSNDNKLEDANDPAVTIQFNPLTLNLNNSPNKPNVELKESEIKFEAETNS